MNESLKENLMSEKKRLRKTIESGRKECDNIKWGKSEKEKWKKERSSHFKGKKRE